MIVEFEPNLNIIKLDSAMASLHCHHYNCGLLKTLEEIKEIDAHKIFIQAANEEFYINFKNYISRYLKDKTAREKLDAAAVLYRSMGFGIIDTSSLNESGGRAYSDSSYYVVGWLAKYGRRETPVCYLTCGFLSGILSAIYDKPSNTYRVEEKKCMITGNEHCEFVVSVNK
ncbi:MAG: 4-vinyl reductase [Nitrospirota bacterium]